MFNDKDAFHPNPTLNPCIPRCKQWCNAVACFVFSFTVNSKFIANQWFHCLSDYQSTKTAFVSLQRRFLAHNKPLTYADLKDDHLHLRLAALYASKFPSIFSLFFILDLPHQQMRPKIFMLATHPHRVCVGLF